MSKKFVVTPEVAYFDYRGKRYKPRETVEITDNFPAEHYTFLKPVEKDAARPARAVEPAGPKGKESS